MEEGRVLGNQRETGLLEWQQLKVCGQNQGSWSRPRVKDLGVIEEDTQGLLGPTAIPKGLPGKASL